MYYNYITVGSEPTAVAVGDFNGDGNQDLAVANYGSQSISVLLGNGNGTFTNGGTISFSASGLTGVYPLAIAAGVLSGTTQASIVTANPLGDNIVVAINTTGGIFSCWSNLHTVNLGRELNYNLVKPTIP